VSHYWSQTSPIRCLGCGTAFSDLADIERERELAKRGYREDRNCRNLYIEMQMKKPTQ